MNGKDSRGRGGAPRRGGPARPVAAGRARAAKKSVSRPAPPPREEPRTFVLGAVPGATPGKWIDLWRERMPHVSLELREITV